MFSEDGVNWKIDNKPITFIQQTRKTLEGENKYDPSVVLIEDRHWFIWCSGYHAPTIGVGYTYDFENVLPTGICISTLQQERCTFSNSL